MTVHIYFSIYIYLIFNFIIPISVSFIKRQEREVTVRGMPMTLETDIVLEATVNGCKYT